MTSEKADARRDVNVPGVVERAARAERMNRGVFGERRVSWGSECVEARREREWRGRRLGRRACYRRGFKRDANPHGGETRRPVNLPLKGQRWFARCLAVEEGRPSRSAVEPPAFLVQHRHFGGRAGFNGGGLVPGAAAVDRRVDGVETREIL